MKRVCLKFFLILTLIAAGVFGTSCQKDIKQKGEVNFSVSQNVIHSIAARAGEISEESGYNDAQQAKVDVTLSVTLYEATGKKKIDTKTQTGKLEDWVQNAAPLSFLFANIDTEKTVYAQATATAKIRGVEKPICSGKSKATQIIEGINDLSIELSFNPDDVYEKQEQQEPDEPEEQDDDDEKAPVAFQITVKGIPSTLYEACDLFVYALSEEKAAAVPKELTNPKTLIQTLDSGTSTSGSSDCKYLGNYELTIESGKPKNEKLSVSGDSLILNDKYSQLGPLQKDKNMTLLVIASDPYTQNAFYLGQTKAFTVSKENNQEITRAAQEYTPVKISFFEKFVNK